MACRAIARVLPVPDGAETYFRLKVLELALDKRGELSDKYLVNECSYSLGLKLMFFDTFEKSLTTALCKIQRRFFNLRLRGLLLGSLFSRKHLAMGFSHCQPYRG
jgi:hypothetical protein